MNSLNLADVFIGLGARLTDRTAVVSTNVTLTYGELLSRAVRSARELRERGITAGSRVGIATRESAESLTLLIAVWMLGATGVPIDFRAKPNERNTFADEFELFAMLDDRPMPEIPDCPSHIVDDAWPEVIARWSASPLLENHPSVPALIAPTSGTSGKPIGMVIDHERLLFRLLMTKEDGERQPGGRLLLSLPFTYAGPRNQALRQLFDGGTVFFRPPLFSGVEFADALLSTRATNVCAVPTMLRELLVKHRARITPLFSDLRILTCFGAPLNRDEKLLARRVLSERFLEIYNSSVSGRISSLFGVDMEARPESVGRVHPHVAIQIVDEDDKEVPYGEPGAIRVRSCTMARATCGKTPRTSGDRLKQGWAYTGDIGSLDKDGFLTLHGRESDVIVRAGVNVHPSEVEAAISSVAGVREAAVVGFASTREGEEIAAFVVTDGTLSETALDLQLRSMLAADRRPRKLFLVDRLPRNANGKILRTDLRAKLEQPS